MGGRHEEVDTGIGRPGDPRGRHSGGRGGWCNETRSGTWQTLDQPGAITAITQTAGGAMGLIAVIMLIAFVTHKRRGN